MTLQEMVTSLDTSEDLDLLNGAKSAYFTVNCWVSWIFTNQNNPEKQMFYMGCKTCKKKVYDEHEGYRCDKCNKIYQEAVPSYNFSVKVQDLADSILLQCLGEVGEAFLGMPHHFVVRKQSRHAGGGGWRSVWT